MPAKQAILDLTKYFSTLDDPRIERQKLHSFPDILLIVFCGAIWGAESWRDFVDFGESKIDFLRQFTPLTYGVPSKNTFCRVVSSPNPEQFKQCFSNWVNDFQQELGRVIAIDAGLVLAQQKVSEKSNEITAIPKFLDLLSLENAVVTIDAMGCQKAIAKQIIERGGDYILAVKGNQNALHS